MSQTINTPLIQVEDLSYSEGKRHILQRINLVLLSDQIVSIIGPNGAGKTTLIKLIVGLITPTAGKIYQTIPLTIGYMPQRLHIDPTLPLTVERFLRLGQTCSATTFNEMLTEVDILHVLARSMQSISGGEFQRVLLARALLRKPQLLVLDEPAQGVDLVGQSELYDLIAKIKDKYHCGILLVSHDLNIVMARTDKVVCLNQHVCCSGHPEEVSRDPAFAALFGKVATNLAFYTHRHDHRHDMHGHIVDPSKEEPE